MVEVVVVVVDGKTAAEAEAVGDEIAAAAAGSAAVAGLWEHWHAPEEK